MVCRVRCPWFTTERWEVWKPVLKSGSPSSRTRRKAAGTETRPLASTLCNDSPLNRLINKNLPRGLIHICFNILVIKLFLVWCRRDACINLLIFLGNYPHFFLYRVCLNIGYHGNSWKSMDFYFFMRMIYKPDPVNTLCLVTIHLDLLLPISSSDQPGLCLESVSYTHLTLPTT